MPKQEPNEEQIATLRVVIQQCESDLQTLASELKLRQQGVIRSTEQEIDGVRAKKAELEHRLAEHRAVLKRVGALPHGKP